MENTPFSQLTATEIESAIEDGNQWMINRMVKPVVLQHKDTHSLHEIFDLLGIESRYNKRLHEPEIRFPGAYGFQGIPPRDWNTWVIVDTRVSSWLRSIIAERFQYASTNGPRPLKYGAEAWGTAFNAMLVYKEVDPFKEWLNELPGWDEKTRIETMLCELFDAEDTPLNRWASAFFTRGPVHRAIQPGAKLDSMPVLIGAQGIGKSAFCQRILPPEYPQWHADGLHLAAPAKDRAEALQGRVIVEASEMAGASRAELESLKAFLTRTDDGTIRMAYRTHAEYMPRTCIIVGTSNDAECLPNDPTGLRRFVPVHLHKGSHVEAYMNENRNQLWAEALAWVELEGLDASLPRTLIPHAAKQAETARRSDEILEYRIMDIEKPLPGTGLALSTIADLVGMTQGEKPLDMRQSKRLANGLRTCGWFSVRHSHARLWYHPDERTLNFP